MFGQSKPGSTPADDHAHFTIHVSASPLWVGAVMDALATAAARRHIDPRIDLIVATMERLLHMSETQASSNAALTASVATLSADMTQFSADLTAGLADLKAQIAAGSTPDFSAVDAATAAINTIDAGLKTASDALKAATAAPITNPGTTAPTDPGTTTPAPVVFDPSDVTPNSAGGRNSSHMPGFDATQPETA
jgi:hypothetical protein